MDNRNVNNAGILYAVIAASTKVVIMIKSAHFYDKPMITLGKSITKCVSSPNELVERVQPEAFFE